MQLSEERLKGGHNTTAVVRIGETVRRPVGAWSPAVHALLLHLEAVGFGGAPRFLGIDGAGREVLEFIPGDVPWPETHYRLLGSDAAMVRAGRLLRAYHEAARTFVPPAGAVWRLTETAVYADPFIDERGVIICHNDATAWNLVIGPERWAFIDWDHAGPRPAIWDVAFAALGLVPLGPEAASFCGWPDEPSVGKRLLALAEGYGLAGRDRARLPDAILVRIEALYAHMKGAAERGEAPYARLWAEGHGAAWRAIGDWTRERVAEWKAVLA